MNKTVFDILIYQLKRDKKDKKRIDDLYKEYAKVSIDLKRFNESIMEQKDHKEIVYHSLPILHDKEINNQFNPNKYKNHVIKMYKIPFTYCDYTYEVVLKINDSNIKTQEIRPTLYISLNEIKNYKIRFFLHSLLNKIKSITIHR